MFHFYRASAINVIHSVQETENYSEQICLQAVLNVRNLFLARYCEQARIGYHYMYGGTAPKKERKERLGRGEGSHSQH